MVCGEVVNRRLRPTELRGRTGPTVTIRRRHRARTNSCKICDQFRVQHFDVRGSGGEGERRVEEGGDVCELLLLSLGKAVTMQRFRLE